MVAVFDNKSVVAGSFNWSPSIEQTNDEVLSVINLPKLSSHLTQEFDGHWETAG